MTRDETEAAATEHEGYPIERAAAITGVAPHTLRYYEGIGLLAPVPRDGGGRRRYTEGDLGAIGFLTLLRRTGMPIRGMQAFMALTREGDHTIGERVTILEEHRGELREHLEQLQHFLAALDNKITIYRGILGDQAPAAAGTETR